MATLLMGKQPAFVAEYVANELAGKPLADYEVALKAGYAKSRAHVASSQLLADGKILAAIAERRTELAKGVIPDVDAARVLREWTEIALADGTQITQVRRLNCRHCHGEGHGYQWGDREYADLSAQSLQDGDEPPEYAGGGGFQRLRDPHPHCPECGGEGIEDVYIADFRKLPASVRRLIVGVEQTKNGVKVITRDQDAALQNIAKFLGMLVDKRELSGPNGGPIPTANVNFTLPADPVEASRVYQALMEGKPLK